MPGDQVGIWGPRADSESLMYEWRLLSGLGAIAHSMFSMAFFTEPVRASWNHKVTRGRWSEG